MQCIRNIKDSKNIRRKDIFRIFDVSDTLHDKILKISEEKIFDNLESLRKNQFVLMSPQRQNDKLIKIYEILPEGIEKIDKTEAEGFKDERFDAIKPEVEILGLIDEVVKQIQDLPVDADKKESIVERLSRVKEKLEI